MSRVEYYDPDGLYPLVAPHLQAHLPLKNLYWNSVNRPVRSIPSLNVDFVPSSRNSTNSSTGKSGDDASTARRHQLPGLRPTPLLKIFLLRCDDREAYKTLKRPLLRQWLDEDIRPVLGPSSSAVKQDKHDAFEWLVLHVVLPNTLAASQPRWTKGSASDDEGTKEKSVSKRWPGKGSRGIFEKLRSDFGAASKSEIDHVAQIRLPADSLPLEAFPSRPVGAPEDYAESPKERESAWSDLLVKLRSFILLSFDSRVTQYEEDIHARDLQRTLPGWNFCTFFVLKEGLALAFESIGLVEDSIVIYDELSAGFEAIVSEDATSASSKTFQSSTDEAMRLLRPSNDAAANQPAEPVNLSLLNNPLNPNRKNYRELIASSNVSVFDFRCYLISRQIVLLLKLARPLLGGQSRETNGSERSMMTKRDSAEGSEKVDDYTALEKVCHSASQSITSLARSLRLDLYQGIRDKREMTVEDEKFIDVIVSAWTYAACNQFLTETASFRIPEAFPKPDATSMPLSPLARSLAEQRSPTISQSKARPPAISSGVREPSAFPSDIPVLRHDRLAKSAAHRADLCLLQRRIVERVAGWYNWPLAQLDEISESIEEIDDQKTTSSDENFRAPSPYAQQLEALSGSVLNSMAASAAGLRKHYHEMSDIAAVLYLGAGRLKSAERLMADVGIMKFNEGDYATAASYLGRIAAKFADGKWNIVETRILKMHMVSLKMLNRRDDCIRVGLELLAKSADLRRGAGSHTATGDWRESSRELGAAEAWLEDSGADSEALLAELGEYSKQLTYDLSTPLNRYFTDFENDRYIKLLDDQDGFEVGVDIRQLVANEKITVDAVEARLISSEDGQSREISLRSTKPVQINFSKSRVWLSSRVSTYGSYIFDKMTIRSGKILFTWEALGKSDAATPVGLLTSTAAAAVQTAKRSAMLCYPRAESLRATLKASRDVHISKGKRIELDFFSGANEIQSAQLILRSGSAGLRLHTAEASVLHGNVQIDPGSGPGIVNVTQSPKDCAATLAIPYEVEHSLPALYVRLEVNYTKVDGSFAYFANFDINVEIPLDVTVQDIFREHSIFSKFFVKPAGKGPIRLLAAQFSGSEAFDVQAASTSFPAAVVFQQEPACVAYKIYPRGKTEAVTLENSTLPLSLSYLPVLEYVIQSTLESLVSHLEETRFQQMKWLFAMTMESNIRRNVMPDDLDAAGLTEEFLLPSLDDLGIRKILEAVGPSEREAVLVMLQAWHKEHSVISLGNAFQADSANEKKERSLNIDFEVPRLPYLHTASVCLGAKEGSRKQDLDTIIQVGNPLCCSVRTRFTRRWDGTTGSDASQSEEHAFVYDVRVDTDLWAVSGAKRARFEARAEEEKVFEMTLVPLRSGKASLPTVEIKPLIILPSRPSSAGDDGSSGGGQALMSPTFTNGPASPSPTSGSTGTGGWMLSPSVSSTLGGDGGPSPQGVCETDCITAGDSVAVVEGWSGVAVGICDAEENEAEEKDDDAFHGFEGETYVLESEAWSTR